MLTVKYVNRRQILKVGVPGSHFPELIYEAYL